jgi:acyl carrier protein
MGLDSVELLMRVEEHFEIRVTDQEAESVLTVGDLLNLVCAKLFENGQRTNPSVISKQLVDIIADQAGISADEIRLESTIVDDLGIN